MTDELAVYWDDAVTAHRPPDGAFSRESTAYLAVDEAHPDRPERVRNIRRILERAMPEATTFRSVKPATEAELTAVHDPGYVARIRESSREGGERLTPTTATSPGTDDAARHAAGAAMQTAAAALGGESGTVPYALVRPSGHHAQPDRADGFCFFNNVAVAAEYALDETAAERVAVVDWDVHHGNGTQEVFYDRDDVLAVSLHNDHGSWDPDSHPQTGRVDEQGTGRGTGYTVNVPLPLGTGDEGYRYAFESVVEPVVESFDPDLLLVAAGQDPGERDPLGRNVVTNGGFRELGRRARALAADAADGHLGIVQEGGYQLSALAFATLAVLTGATGRDVELEGGYDLAAGASVWSCENADLAAEWVDAAADAHGEHWDL
ncbi:MAG: class II histone deacetylase [Haloferacaceae archaeon]